MCSEQTVARCCFHILIKLFYLLGHYQRSTSNSCRTLQDLLTLICVESVSVLLERFNIVLKAHYLLKSSLESSFESRIKSLTTLVDSFDAGRGANFFQQKLSFILYTDCK